MAGEGGGGLLLRLGDPDGGGIPHHARIVSPRSARRAPPLGVDKGTKVDLARREGREGPQTGRGGEEGRAQGLRPGTYFTRRGGGWWHALLEKL